MEVFVVLLVLVLLFASCGLVYVIFYNLLQGTKIKTHGAEVIIDEALRDKYDLIIRGINAIKADIKINDDYFKEVENLTKIKLSNFDLDRKLAEAINFILKLINDYAQLNGNKELNEVLKEIKMVDEKLEAGKSFYNKYTEELNALVKKFPSNIVSRLHGFKTKFYFDGKNLEDEITKDFKL